MMVMHNKLIEKKMKKAVYIYIVLFLTGIVFSGCDEDEKYLPKDTPSVFRFPSNAVALDEDRRDAEGEPIGEGNSVTLTVTWHKHQGEAGNINLQVFPRTNVPAIEGVDYTISTKSLSFAADQYTQTFTINTFYDPTFTGRKTFTVKIVSSDDVNARIGAFGASDSCVVTINDVNHPLVELIGNATLSFVNYFNQSATLSYDVTLSPDPDDPTILWMPPNFNTYNNPLKLVVEVTEDGYEVTIPLPVFAGQNASETQGGQFVAVFFGGDSGTSLYFTGDEYKLTGFTPKGDISIEFEDAFGQRVIDNGTPISSFFVLGVPGTLRITK